MALPNVRRAVSQLEEALEHALVLNAAKNVMSPGARAILGSSLADGDLAGRGAKLGDQRGAKAYRLLEECARELTLRLFGTPHAELRATSGSLANGLAAAALTDPGDVILVPPAWAYGHKSLGAHGYVGAGGRQVVEMAWDGPAMSPDLDGLRAQLRELRPRVVVLGLSRTLFPEPIADVAALARESGVTLHYDGAHVLGLIAGGAYPNPLSVGFDVLTGSTNKTIPGPVGGLLLCRAPQTLQAIEILADDWLASFGANRVAALAHVLGELAEVGREYAGQVVANARALARSLHQEGFRVVGADRGYTDTHQILIDVTDLAPPAELTEQLAEAAVQTNPPTRADRRLRDGQVDGWWLRLGTAAVTRRGLGAPEMEQIARLLGRLLLRGEDPAWVRRKITPLIASHRRTVYVPGD